MIKTYVSALLVALLAVQMAHARESMANVFALLDAADKADGQPTTPTSSASDAAPAEQAPGNEESDTLSWLLEKGKEQYKVGNYDEAIMMFDGVLAIDKYNKDAVAYRHRTAKRIAAKEAKKQGA
ncbi:MAG: hypothetical protein ABFR33_12100, partial [Verrucomicrobiota bacterium]